MNVLLVNPPGMMQGTLFDIPTNLLYLYSSLRKAGIQCYLADGNLSGMKHIKDAIEGLPTGLVGISCLTPVRFTALEIAKYAKEHGWTTVLGGHHAHWMWKQILDNYPYVDACAFGEGEQTIVDLATMPMGDVLGIAYRANGQVIRTHARRYVDIDAIEFPAWDMVDWQAYRSIGRAIGPRVYYSRGCGAHCKFCNSTKFWRGYRHRSAKNFCDELAWLGELGRDVSLFGDDNATGEEAKALFSEMASRKGKFAYPISVTTRVDTIDAELCKLMAQCHVGEVCLGVESGSQRMIDHMDKRISVEQAKTAIGLVKAHGMRATALMIYGAIGETQEDREASKRFIAETNPNSIGTVGSLWIFPGTKYYEEIRAGKYDAEIIRGKEFVDDAFFLNPAYAQHVISWNRGVISPQRVTEG